MTTGALIFARNNEQIDYEAMAHWSARNIERHLGIPTHIVTDDSRTDSGSRHFTDTGTVAWHNTNRMDAYRLSPWDRTLVLDADYVITSDQLRGVSEILRNDLAGLTVETDPTSKATKSGYFLYYEGPIADHHPVTCPINSLPGGTPADRTTHDRSGGEAPPPLPSKTA